MFSQVQVIKCSKISSYVYEKEGLCCKHMMLFFSPNRNTNYYTGAEDRALLNFIVQRRRYSEAGGVQLWKLMERKQAVPGKRVLQVGKANIRFIILILKQ